MSWPGCAPNEYCVVARLFDHPSGKSFIDLHFTSKGTVGAMVAGESDSDPGKLEDTGLRWKRKKWLRITIAMDVDQQTFDVYMDGRKSKSGPWRFTNFYSGQLETLWMEGPHSGDPTGFFYYDDMRWADVDPLKQ